jgi:hypothetical protein
VGYLMVADFGPLFSIVEPFSQGAEFQQGFSKCLAEVVIPLDQVALRFSQFSAAFNLELQLLKVAALWPAPALGHTSLGHYLYCNPRVQRLSVPSQQPPNRIIIIAIRHSRSKSVKTDSNSKRTSLLVRCSPEEAHQIREAAKRERRTISDFILNAVMSRMAVQERLHNRMQQQEPKRVKKAASST